MKKQYVCLVEQWHSPKNDLHRVALIRVVERFNQILFETTPGAFVLTLRIEIDKCNEKYSRCDPLTVVVTNDCLEDEGKLIIWVGNRVANIAVVKVYEVKK